MLLTHNFRGKASEMEFSGKEIVIGRPNPFMTPDLDLSEDIYVSRTHARLWMDNGYCWVEDLCSKHGTFVNEVRLEYPRQLNEGDVVRVGETQITVELPGTIRVVPQRTSAASEMRVEAAVNVEESSAGKVAANDLDKTRLAVLLELPVELASKAELTELLSVVLKDSRRLWPDAQSAAVLLRNRDNGHLELRAVQPTGTKPVVAMAERVFTEGRALAWRERDGNAQGRHGIYAPLVWRNKVLGVLCVDSAQADAEFTVEDLQLLNAVASYAGIAVASFRMQDAV